MIGIKVDYIKIAAIVELQDAQGWKTISNTPRYRAEVDKVEIEAVDVYALIVDKIDLTDEVITTEQVVFEFTKVISDEGIVIDSIVFEMDKPFSDNSAVSDSIFFNVGKLFSDNVSQSDSPVFSMNKAISDGAISGDSTIFNLTSDISGAINESAINLAGVNEANKTVRIF